MKQRQSVHKYLDSCFKGKNSEGIDLGTVASLLYLLWADTMLNQGMKAGTDIDTLLQRNTAVICEFNHLFQDLTDHYKENSFLQSCHKFIKDWYALKPDPDDLYHLPGGIYERQLLECSLVTKTRKKQGSYYTPVSLVKYMFTKAFRHLSNQIELKDVKILDPACGGAAFLIEALKFLVESGLEIEDAVQAVYGTDQDAGAIEVSVFIMTIVSSALGKEKDRIRAYKTHWQRNLQMGNALQKRGRTAAEGKKINKVFAGINWNVSFPEVFDVSPAEDPGFHIVIGNPPYIANKLLSKAEKAYYGSEYMTAIKQFDITVPFIEQGIQLLKDKGILSYIISNKFMVCDYGLNLRKMLLEESSILEIIDVSSVKNFRKTATYPVIFNLRKTWPDQEHTIKISERTVEDGSSIGGSQIPQCFFAGLSDQLISSLVKEKHLPVLHKIAQAEGTIENAVIRCGIAKAGFGTQICKQSSPWPTISANEDKVPIIQSGHIKDYHIEGFDLIHSNYLKEIKYKLNSGPRLVIPGLSLRLRAGLDQTGSALGRVYYIEEKDMKENQYYLLMLLNSELLNFYYKLLYWPVHLEGDYLRFNSTYLSNLPIMEGKSGSSKKITEELIKMGTLISSQALHSDERAELKIKSDTLIFKLYGLTKEEMMTVLEFNGVAESHIRNTMNYYDTM